MYKVSIQNIDNETGEITQKTYELSDNMYNKDLYDLVSSHFNNPNIKFTLTHTVCYSESEIYDNNGIIIGTIMFSHKQD
jgi:hypothetical protein